MNLNHMKATAAALWVLAMGAVGLQTNVSSPSNWMVLAACAIVPPVVMMRFWNHPDQTMSESIQQVLRRPSPTASS